MNDRPKIKYKSAPPKRGRGRPPKAKPEPDHGPDIGVNQFSVNAEHDLVSMESIASGGFDGSGNLLDLDDAELVRSSLRKILMDQGATPASKASAARTMAEITGLVGRNSKPPADQSKPLASLSRDELAAELAALEADE